jgi:hypothetical protein
MAPAMTPPTIPAPTAQPKQRACAGGGAAKSETAIDVAAANASKDLFIAVVSCKGDWADHPGGPLGKSRSWLWIFFGGNAHYPWCRLPGVFQVYSVVTLSSFCVIPRGIDYLDSAGILADNSQVVVIGTPQGT